MVTLIDLVKADICKKWNWCCLSTNKCISVQDIIDNINLNWNWVEVFTRHDINIKNALYIINSKKLLSFVFNELCANQSLMLNDLLKIEETGHKLCWHAISNNKNITIYDVLAHPNRPWNWDILSKKIPIDDIIKNKHLPWKVIMIKKEIDIHYIKEHSDLQWKMGGHWSYNYRGKIFILNNSDLPWDWTQVYKYHFSRSSVLSYKYEIRWKLHSAYPDMTSGFIRANIDKSWDFKALSSNVALTLNIIRRHSNKPWDYNAISKTKGDLGMKKMKIMDILSKYKICFDLAEIIYEYSENVYKNFE